MEAPQNKRFYGKMGCLALWPNYIGEKGRTLGKTYGISKGLLRKLLRTYHGGYLGSYLGYGIPKNYLGGTSNLFFKLIKIF
jgi:hypothetical protein